MGAAAGLAARGVGVADDGRGVVDGGRGVCERAGGAGLADLTAGSGMGNAGAGVVERSLAGVAFAGALAGVLRPVLSAADARPAALFERGRPRDEPCDLLTIRLMLRRVSRECWAGLMGLKGEAERFVLPFAPPNGVSTRAASGLVESGASATGERDSRPEET